MPPQRDFVLLGLLVLSLASVLLTSNLILTTWNVHRGGSHRHLSYHIGSTGKLEHSLRRVSVGQTYERLHRTREGTAGSW